MQTQITLPNIQEGMILALPLKNKMGQMMIPADTIIEERHIRLMKTWGIASVFIKSTGNEANSEEADNSISEETLKLLQERMNWKPVSVYEEDLYLMGINQLKEKGF